MNIDKNELIKIGFKDTFDGWLTYSNDKFEITINLDAEKPYFFIGTFMSDDRDTAPYPYVNADKLKGIIDANIEYFK